MKRIYKVYNDGGAFIGIRKVESNSAPRRKPVPEEPIVVRDYAEAKEIAAALVHDEDYENMIDPAICANERENICITTLTGEFKRFYRQTVGMRWKKRRKYVTDMMRPYFDNEDDLEYFISRKMHNAYRASTARLNRCKRRVALHGLDWFKDDGGRVFKEITQYTAPFCEQKGLEVYGRMGEGRDRQTSFSCPPEHSRRHYVGRGGKAQGV